MRKLLLLLLVVDEKEKPSFQIDDDDDDDDGVVVSAVVVVVVVVKSSSVREEEVVCSYMSQIKKDHDRAYSQVFTVVFRLVLQKKGENLSSSFHFQFFSGCSSSEKMKEKIECCRDDMYKIIVICI